MSSPTYARLVSQVLVPHLEAVPVPAPTPEARNAAIEAVAQAISARARKRVMVRWTAGLAAAAAFAVVVGAAVRANRHAPVVAVVPPKAAVATEPAGILAHPVDQGSSVVLMSGTEAPLVDGDKLQTGSRVVTPHGAHVGLTMPTGTKIALDENTDMTVRGEGSTQAFQLTAGAIDLKVAKLKEKERFLVNTPDTEVEVRGTQFHVAVVPPEAGCGGGAQTRVVVTEGVVVVRRAGGEVRVAAGEQWPMGCGRGDATEAAPAHRSKASRGAGDTPSSTLNEQNDLYSLALAAKSRGDVAGSLDEFDRFLRTYPTSALAESAMVERMRLLRTSNPAKAEDAAIEYLTRYPKGSAHTEAEAVVRGTP